MSEFAEKFFGFAEFERILFGFSVSISSSMIRNEREYVPKHFSLSTSYAANLQEDGFSGIFRCFEVSPSPLFLMRRVFLVFSFLGKSRIVEGALMRKEIRRL